MADSKGFDAILGVSKKIIQRADDSIQPDHAKEKLLSAINRLKEKSQELSEKKMDTFDSTLEVDTSVADQVHDDLTIKTETNDHVDIQEDTHSPDEQDLVQSCEEVGQETDQTHEHETNPKGVSNGESEGSLNESSHVYMNHLLTEIEFLKSQLEVKDQQIETKDQQLNKKDELILNFQVLLKSEQDKVLRLESKMTESSDEVESVKTQVSEETNKSWFVKIFGKRTR